MATPKPFTSADRATGQGDSRHRSLKVIGYLGDTCIRADFILLAGGRA